MYSFYALHTMPGREHKAKSDLEHRFANIGAADRVRQIVVPQMLQVDIAPDGTRREKIVNPLPGYLLIEANISDQLWGLILMTPGVHAVGANSKTPTPLSAREVDRILQRERKESPAAVAAAGHDYRVGDIVEITGGPFAGMEANVVEADSGHDDLRVQIVLFERIVPTSIDAADVRLLHRGAV